MRKVTDAEFEVISGPTPVRWQPEPKKSGLPWFKIAYMTLICAVAGWTLFLGLIGADIDTRDAVAADQSRQPVAAALR